MLLDGKVVIVSGVGPGLGQANARALAREGATVVLAARNAEYLAGVASEIGEAGGRALAVSTNLVDGEQVEALVEKTVDAFGRIDGLVNNAFRMDVFQPFDQVDLVKWRKIFDVNVWGSLALTQACVPHLKKAAADAGDASIVFIISMSMRKIRPLEGGYSSSKAALQTAAKTMALELGPTGVRVNCIAPGWIGGPNVEVFLGWESEARGISQEEVRAEIESNIPLGRIPPQDDIANSVVFFISPWSRVITGQTLDVNGGEFFG
ncbi:MAG TPA: SDR family oxidoreductase [Acidimicrobiia bacterium]|jgi:NAD(P)-dependent dehydrogenase (short-subunit alcohol dehydrogenase family)|nr:SDR family oxidoreductase [Acidimicrobiia bacterium]